MLRCESCRICKSEPTVFERVIVSFGIEAHETINNEEKIKIKILVFILFIV